MRRTRIPESVEAAITNLCEKAFEAGEWRREDSYEPYAARHKRHMRAIERLQREIRKLIEGLR